jgi:DNA-binding CsgD family transcriptional regulator
VAASLQWNDVNAPSVYHSLALLGEADVVITSRALGQAFLSAHCPALTPNNGPAWLSPAEYETTRMLALGLTPQEIAAQRHVAPQTIAEHLRRARQKLGARTNP